MRLSVRLTLDGMIRALRWQAHRLAEDADRSYVEATDEGAGRLRLEPRRPARREENMNERGE